MLVLTREINQNILIEKTRTHDSLIIADNITVCLVHGTNYKRFVVRLNRSISWNIEKHLRCDDVSTKNISIDPDNDKIAYVLLLSNQTLWIDDVVTLNVFYSGKGRYKFGLAAPKSISFVREELTKKGQAELLTVNELIAISPPQEPIYDRF